MFIVLDGLDGSGKSTQAKLLNNYLVNTGKTVILRTHPNGDNFFGRLGRAYLLLDGTTARMAASLFYLLDVVRSVILYRWRNADVVIFVRYLMGTAYLPTPLHKLIYLFFLRTMPLSSHMYFIDTSPEESHRRIEENRTRKEMFESLEKLRTVCEKVLELAQRGEWTIIDGNKSAKKIHEEIKAAFMI
jgi:dTMP kinase